MTMPSALLLPLIADIYRSAQDASAWGAVMAGMVSLLQGRSARLLTLNTEGTTVHHSLKYNIDDSYHQPYVDHFVNLCPWRPELKSKPEGMLYSSFLDFSCSQKTFQRSEFYNDWARPQGIEHGLCGTIYRDRSQIVQLLVQRTPEPGHFTRQDQSLANSLVAHIQQALTLGAALTQANSDSALIQAANQNFRGFLLLDDRMWLRYADPAASEWLTRSVSVSVKHKQLHFSQPSHQNSFLRLFSDCRATTHQQSCIAGGRIPLIQDNCVLRFSPVSVDVDHPLLQLTNTAVAVIIEEAVTAPLSPREQHLAEALATGSSLREYATLNKLSYETVRYQLKNAFAKTGTHRQHELVAWLLRR
jgi:DNA-binding CsgD family transcriptional regulator